MKKINYIEVLDKTVIPEIETLPNFDAEDNSPNIVLAIAGLSMGESDVNLGKELMLDLLNDLPRQKNLPRSIVFYNSGVMLACEDSLAVSTLKFLQAQKIKILVCKKSLEYFALDKKLMIGDPASIHEINNCLLSADYIIRP